MSTRQRILIMQAGAAITLQSRPCRHIDLEANTPSSGTSVRHPLTTGANSPGCGDRVGQHYSGGPMGRVDGGDVPTPLERCCLRSVVLATHQTHFWSGALQLAGDH
jgi:hypothetical protein